MVAKVNSRHDRGLLQSDLEQLMHGQTLGRFHSTHLNAINIMHIGRMNQEFQYSLGNQNLETVTEQTDLVVQLTADLKPSTRCQKA